MGDSSHLPYGRQWIDERDIEAVVEVLRGDWLTTGPKVQEFERAGAGFALADVEMRANGFDDLIADADQRVEARQRGVCRLRSRNLP